MLETAVLWNLHKIVNVLCAVTVFNGFSKPLHLPKTNVHTVRYY